MALVIKSAGLDDYLDEAGGTTNLKALILGRPGSGKTRSSAYWSKPLLIDCERSRSVVADLGMPYVEVLSEAEVDEFIRELGKWTRDKKSGKEVAYETLVLDTVDGLQDRLVAAYLARTGKQKLDAMGGDYDAINGPVERLINALKDSPFNVIVNVHLKEVGQFVKRGETATAALGEDTIRTAQSWGIALRGGIREKIPGWFDLVGCIENSWGLNGTEKIVNRHIRWQPTPELPILKDRLYAFPRKTPVNFESADYERLVGYIKAKSERIRPTAVVEEIGEPDKAVGPDIKSGPVSPNPSGVLPKPRLPKAEPAEKPAEKPAEGAAEQAAKASEQAPVEKAVGQVSESLGGEVVAVESSWEERVEAVESVDAAHELWNQAYAAGALTSDLKAAIIMRVAALNKKS